MKALVLVTALLSAQVANASGPLQLESDYIHCFDGTTEVSIIPQGDVLEEDSSLVELLSKKNIVKIRTNDQVYSYTQDIVIMADGYGNDAVQALVVDRFGPISAVMQFTFEHEGGYLDGFYALPKSGVNLQSDRLFEENFQEAKSFENMLCNSSLLGNFGINSGF